MTTHSNVSSNAFNYLDFFKSNVDPRTGQYTLSIDLPNLKANSLSGPDLPLTLDFSPLNLEDSGYGIGWNLRLSQYVIARSMLSLYTGESFKITGDGAEPSIAEKRLDSFRFFDDGNDTWRVVHHSGLVEVLTAQGGAGKRVALPTLIYGPGGHAIKLTWADFANGERRLAKIEDARGELLRIVRDSENVKVLLPPFDDQPQSRFLMKLSGDRVREIILPVAEQASWRLDYITVRGLTCIKEVKTPMGAHETLEYLDGGHAYPGSSGRPNLPRVTRHLASPGPDLAVHEATYTYSTNNFLGNGSGINWMDDGLDQLYKVDFTYDYSTTVQQWLDGKPVRQVKHTYNRFHLQVEEETRQGKCVFTKVIDYYAENKPFDQQPKQFQMPRSVQHTWRLEGDSSKIQHELQLSEYDEHGNKTLEVRPDGVSTRTVFYDPAGEDGCPKDPFGFTRNVKEVIVTPAPQARGDAPVMITRYRYSQHAPLNGAPGSDWLMVSEESLFERRDDKETLLNHSLRTYYETPDNPQLHGRPLRQVNTLNGTSNSTDYHYGKARNKLLDQESLQTVETFTGYDGEQKVYTSDQALNSGQLLLGHDPNDVQVRFEYDNLRRLTTETVAPGSDFEATRSYAYQLVHADGQQATRTVTDVKQVLTRDHYDGLGRVLLSEVKTGAAWQRTYSAVYDGLGQLSEETRYDRLEDRELSLTTRYAYNDWGQRCRVTGPDGVSLVTETTPFGEGGKLQRSWRESVGDKPLVSMLSVTQYNAFGKIDWTERHDDEDKVVGRQVYIYDGYGECIRADEELALETRSTHFQYDSRRRVAHTRLPDQTVVERSFAEHSRGELPTAIRVIPGDDQQTTLLLGEQQFDGLDRLTRLTVGPRSERYEYDDQTLRASRLITPAQATIEYFYEQNLSDQPKTIIVDGQTFTYGFDRDDAGIKSATSDAGERAYTYNVLGHLKSESWTDSNGEVHETHYETSLQGLPLKRTDNAVDTLYTYDDEGRVQCMTQGQLQAEFEYDDNGRQYRTTTRDLGSEDSLVSENTYDSLDRVWIRTLLLNDSPARTLTHTWRDDDQLVGRHLEMDGRSLLLEEYVYDQRGRLTEHHCSGERLPSDRYGNAITDQMFRFDALGNIKRCLTSFANGETNVAIFTYAEDDSCQLIKVTNSYVEGGYPGEQTFAYDDDGNQLNDEAGQRLRYDAQGRLLEVTSADGSESLVSYRYDGHQHLVGARIGGQAETLRFYQGYSLSHTVQDGVQTQYFSHAGQPLGQQQLNDHERTMLLLTDASPSVIGASLASGLREVVYSAYGELADEQRLESLMGFNGELREVATGWYLLGRGYRAYNPSLMRFHNPDSRSPFLEGGLNPYTYCLGNPIRFRDPTGHRAENPRRPDPIYRPPPPEPGAASFLEKWGPAAGLILGAVVMAVFTPWTGGLTIPLVVGAIGVAVSAAGGALAVVATLNEDREMLTLATILVTVGGAISAAGGALDRWGPKDKWGWPKSENKPDQPVIKQTAGTGDDAATPMIDQNAQQGGSVSHSGKGIAYVISHRFRRKPTVHKNTNTEESSTTTGPVEGGGPANGASDGQVGSGGPGSGNGGKEASIPSTPRTPDSTLHTKPHTGPVLHMTSGAFEKNTSGKWVPTTGGPVAKFNTDLTINPK